MQIENSICDYDAVEKVNDEMRVQLKAIVQQKFFRYYKVTTASCQALESNLSESARHLLEIIVALTLFTSFPLSY